MVKYVTVIGAKTFVSKKGTKITTLCLEDPFPDKDFEGMSVYRWNLFNDPAQYVVGESVVASFNRFGDLDGVQHDLPTR